MLRSILFWSGLLGLLLGTAEVGVSVFWTHNQHNELVGYDLMIVGILVTSDRRKS